jgi:hypothetical protein
MPVEIPPDTLDVCIALRLDEIEVIKAVVVLVAPRVTIVIPVDDELAPDNVSAVAREGELLVADDPEYICDWTDGIFSEVHGDIVTERTERIEVAPVCTIIDVSVVEGV